MIIKNPTDLKLEVQINGLKYVVEPKSSISGVNEENALYWKKKIHEFVVIEPEKVIKIETPIIEEKVVAKVVEKTSKK